MSVTPRYFSTGFWTSTVVEQDLVGIDEKLFWTYIKTNASTTLCGFYQFSIPTACAQTGIDFKRAAELIAKLEQLGLLVYDRSYLWIHGYTEEQQATAWAPLASHIHKQNREYLSNGGSPENRAYKCFLARFEDVLAKPVERKARKGQGSSQKKKAAPPSVESFALPEYSLVKRFFAEFRSEGAGVACPNPEAESDTFYEWFRTKGLDKPWQEKAVSWCHRRIKEQSERAEKDRRTMPLANGGQLAI